MTGQPQGKLWNRDFAILWAALTQSVLGDRFLAIGLMWLALEISGSPAVVGVVLALSGVSELFGPLAGAVVDRVNKRALLVMSGLSRGVLLGLAFALSQGGVLEIWHIYLLVVALGFLELPYAPAVQVLLPKLVPDASLPAANGLVKATGQTSSILGASLAGIMLAVYGAPVALLVAAITYFLSALALFLVRFPPALVMGRVLGAVTIFRDVGMGLRFIGRSGEILKLIALLFFINFVLSPVNVIFPVYSREVLGGGIEGFGLLAAAIAAGLLAGSIVVGAIGDRLGYAQSFLIGLAIMTLALTGLSAVTGLIPALALTAALGAGPPFISVPLVTRLQRVVPDEYKGRVFATMQSVISLALPVAAVLAGQALIVVSVPWIFRFAGAGTLTVALLWLWLGRSTRAQAPRPGPGEPEAATSA